MNTPVQPGFGHEPQETNHAIWVFCLAVFLLVFSTAGLFYMKYRVKMMAQEAARQMFIAELKHQEAQARREAAARRQAAEAQRRQSAPAPQGQGEAKATP